MKKPLLNQLGMWAVLGLIATACSNNGGFQTMPSATPGGDNGQFETPPPSVPAPNPIDTVDMKGYVNSANSLFSQYDKVQTLDLDKEAGELIVSMPLGLDSSIVVGGGTVPQLPGVTFYTNIGSDGKTYLVVRVPVRYFLRGVTTIPANRLPNGDPLPKMPAGEYPSVAFDLNTIGPDGKKVYLFVGVDAIGVFIESTLPSCADLHLPFCVNVFSFDIKNTDKTKVVGSFSIVMPKAPYLGGFFISTVLSPELARILDEYFLD